MDRIEAAQERVSECSRLIIQLLDEYDVYMIVKNKDIFIKELEFGYEEEI